MPSDEERIAALEQAIGGNPTIYYPRRQKQTVQKYTNSRSGAPVSLKTRPELLNEGTWSTLTTWKSIDVSSYVPRSATHAILAVKSFLQADIVFKVRGDATYDSFPIAYGSLQGGTTESYAASQVIVELSNWAFEFYIDAAGFAGTLYSIQLVGYFG